MYLRFAITSSLCTILRSSSSVPPIRRALFSYPSTLPASLFEPWHRVYPSINFESLEKNFFPAQLIQRRSLTFGIMPLSAFNPNSNDILKCNEVVKENDVTYLSEVVDDDDDDDDDDDTKADHFSDNDDCDDNFDGEEEVDDHSIDDDIDDDHNFDDTSYNKGHFSRSNRNKRSSPNLQVLRDLSSPLLWYPRARSIKRRIIIHVGPTNSGKTHTAIERLAKSKNGVYCGPLRLLANEIYEKLNQKYAVPCNLLTGQQKDIIPNAQHTSCTIEMCPLDDEQLFLGEVAVIDEFQLISDHHRGWAWSRAILGLPVQELHLCGNGSALQVVKSICEALGDQVEVVHYSRLSPLELAPKHVNISQLASGDAVIAFSRKKVYELKDLIEKNTKHRCCVVYGSLPPKTRNQQAGLFNDPNSPYDIIVASDAIGMGLNLNCKRVIFSSVSKFDGTEYRNLTGDEVKQIAGRAGRYGTLFPVGLVSAFSGQDMRFLDRALQQPWGIAKRAGILPEFDHIVTFMRDNPSFTFADTIQALCERCRLQKLFCFSDITEIIAVAKLLQRLPFRDLRDLYVFSLAPINIEDGIIVRTFLSFARNYVKGKTIRASYTLPQNPNLQSLETLFHILDLYLWLANRFPSQFLDAEPALELSAQVSDQLTDLLRKQTRRTKSHLQKSGESKQKRKPITRKLSLSKSRNHFHPSNW